jgi:hypothetical protein
MSHHSDLLEVLEVLGMQGPESCPIPHVGPALPPPAAPVAEV